MNYILCIERIDKCDGTLHHQFDVPLPGICDEDVAIREANKLKKCLKDNYVVSIETVIRQHFGYAVGCKF